MKMLEDRANGEGLLCLSDDELRSVKRNSSISDVYDVEDTVFARGKFATVRRANHKTTGVQYAAKYIKKRRRAVDMTPEIYHEISVLRKCAPCGRVVRLHEVYETNSDVVLVLELAAGGELQRIFDTDHCLNEVEARRAMRQILEGLGYLHERNIAHLDLKPQNLLLTVEDSCDDIKLCDFGVSRLLAPGAEVRALLGTPDYVAPEVLSYEPISLATDIWSVGVLAYVLLSGYTPFGGDTKQQTYLNISQCILTFEPDHFGDVSTAAIDFIKSSLLVNPRLRPTVQELLKHPWISPKNHILPSLSIKTTEPKDTTPKTTPISQHLNNAEEPSSSDQSISENSNSELIIDGTRIEIRRRSHSIITMQPIIDEILKSDPKSPDKPPNVLTFHEEQPTCDTFPQTGINASPAFENVEEFTRPISNLEPLINGIDDVDVEENDDVEIVCEGNKDEDNENKNSFECVVEEESLKIDGNLVNKQDEQNVEKLSSSEMCEQEFSQECNPSSCDLDSIRDEEFIDEKVEEESSKIEMIINLEDDQPCLSDKNEECTEIKETLPCSQNEYKLEELTNEEDTRKEFKTDIKYEDELSLSDEIDENIQPKEIVSETHHCSQMEYKLEEIINTEIVNQDYQEDNEQLNENSSKLIINDQSNDENIKEELAIIERNIKSDESLSNKNDECMKIDETIPEITYCSEIEHKLEKIIYTEINKEDLDVEDNQEIIETTINHSSELIINVESCNGENTQEEMFNESCTSNEISKSYECSQIQYKLEDTEINNQIEEDKQKKLFEQKNFLLSIGCSEIKHELKEVINPSNYLEQSHRYSCEKEFALLEESKCIDENANLQMKIKNSMTSNFINRSKIDSCTEYVCKDANMTTKREISSRNLDLGFDEVSSETDEDEGRFAEDSYLWEQKQPSKSFGTALSKFKAIEEQTKSNNKTRKVLRRTNFTSHSVSEEFTQIQSNDTSDLELSPEVSDGLSNSNH